MCLYVQSAITWMISFKNHVQLTNMLHAPEYNYAMTQYICISICEIERVQHSAEITVIGDSVKRCSPLKPNITCALKLDLVYKSCNISTQLYSRRCLQKHVCSPNWWRFTVYRASVNLSQPPICRWHISVGPIWDTTMWFKNHCLVRPWSKWHRGSIRMQRDWRATWGCQGLCCDMPLLGVIWLWLSTFPCAVSNLDGHYAGIVSFGAGDTISGIHSSWND